MLRWLVAGILVCVILLGMGLYFRAPTSSKTLTCEYFEYGIVTFETYTKGNLQNASMTLSTSRTFTSTGTAFESTSDYGPVHGFADYGNATLCDVARASSIGNGT